MTSMQKPRKDSVLSSSLTRNAILLVALAMLFPLLPLAAQTKYHESMSLNGGTLSWIATYSTGTCGNEGNGSYSMYEYSNFVYSYNYPSSFYSGEIIPVSVNLIGSVGYIQSASQEPPYCPPVGPEPAGGAPSMDSTDFYRVDFTPTPNGLGSATMESFSVGGVGPQYTVLSVIYAPPGGGGTSNKSYIDYANTTEVGTNTTWDSSFTTASTYTAGGSFFGITTSLSTTDTQEVDDSDSIAINQTTTVSDIYSGAYPSGAVGLDHDNDIILVWLNPALNCVAEEEWTVIPAPVAVQCIIFDPKMAPGDPDDPEMDTVQLPVGWLDGHYTMPADTQQILENHGITSAVYPTLLAVDPYYTCTGSKSATCTEGIGVNLTRFTLVTNAGIIPFEPLGDTTEYYVDYTQTSTQGESATMSYNETYTLSGSETFEKIVTENLKGEESITWTNKWSEDTTSMVGQATTLYITEPTPSTGYGGAGQPTQFAVYQDNIYGSFMLYPTQ